MLDGSNPWAAFLLFYGLILLLVFLILVGIVRWVFRVNAMLRQARRVNWQLRQIRRLLGEQAAERKGPEPLL